MNNINPSSEVKTKNITFSLVFAWFFGVVVGLAGVATLFSNVIAGILFIISALIVLPPTYSFIKDKLHISLSKGLKIAIVLILFVIAGVTSSQHGSNTVSDTNAVANPAPVVQAPAQPTIIVTADKIMSDYTANEVSADAKYKNNTVQVSGIVDSIGKDIMDTPYISLHTGGEYSFSVVQCMFAKSDEPALSNVSKGQSITLIGQVTGKLGNVILNGCRITK